jgi:signal transduction histidine kinase
VGTAWKRDPAEGQRRLDRLLELSQTALREMRSLLFELRPSEGTQAMDELLPHQAQKPALTGAERVNQLGLLEALRKLAQDFSHDGVRVDVRTFEYLPTRFGGGGTAKPGNEMTIQQDIYRIVQEALNNATKHAHAHEILVMLDGSESNQLCLSISDDGVGFAPEGREETQSGGFGMKTMRERAESLGGSLRIRSAPGKGTTVEVTIPLPERNNL